jgi:hypothetical protein
MRKPKAKKALAKGKNKVALSSATLIAGAGERLPRNGKLRVRPRPRGRLAMHVFDKPDHFLLAVRQLDFMVRRFKDRYYAEEFPDDN